MIAVLAVLAVTAALIVLAVLAAIAMLAVTAALTMDIDEQNSSIASTICNLQRRSY